MSDRRAEAAQEWMDIGDEDLLAAEVALNAAPPLTRVACFHSQQAAEKYLKAFLASSEVRIERTHDLAALLTDCTALHPALANLSAEAAGLTPYAVHPRYPVPSPPTVEEARQALDMARTIVNEVRKRIPQS